MGAFSMTAPGRLSLGLTGAIRTARLPPGLARQGPRAGYATVSPSAQDNADDLSARLWKNYNINLRHAFLQTQGKFDSKKQAFFTAPIGQSGIPAGGVITAPYTNWGVHEIADQLLDVNNPVFSAGTGRYFDRQSRYVFDDV
jgi:hypothetical protein